jgi:hypothetical protein
MYGLKVMIIGISEVAYGMVNIVTNLDIFSKGVEVRFLVWRSLS